MSEVANSDRIIKRKLNVKQVAEQLGVSTASVSNAYNRPDQLSKKLRQRILRESAELGFYGPNLAARSLRRGETGVIGVVLADSISYSFSDPVANQLMQGISEVLVTNNKQMLLLSSEVTASGQNGTESLSDGFIICGTLKGNGFEHVKRTGKPFVLVDSNCSENGSVNIDNELGAYNVANYVLSKNVNNHVAILGLRLIDSMRICRLMQGDLQVPNSEISRVRLAGYLRAAGVNKVLIPMEKIWNIPVNSPKIAEIAVREALTSIPLPNVLLCMSDVIALTALHVAKELNINIPNQIQITGFDDIPEASRSTPPLTTVSQQSVEKGRLAANMLLDGNTHDKVILESRLILRQTCK